MTTVGEMIVKLQTLDPRTPMLSVDTRSGTVEEFSFYGSTREFTQGDGNGGVELPIGTLFSPIYFGN